MSLKKRWQEYVQGIVVNLVQQKGITMTLRKTAAGFNITIRWPGPNGRDKRGFTFKGTDLQSLIEEADHHAVKILPVKINAEGGR
jgi:hypothetical protein